MSHAMHIFRRFLLYDGFIPIEVVRRIADGLEGWPKKNTVKVFTDQKWRPGDYWYEGWECRCSEQGYAT